MMWYGMISKSQSESELWFDVRLIGKVRWSILDQLIYASFLPGSACEKHHCLHCVRSLRRRMYRPARVLHRMEGRSFPNEP